MSRSMNAEELQRALNRLLPGWILVWEPNPSSPNRGEPLPGERLIVVHDASPEEALTTVVHEALEVLVRPMLQPYRTLANALLEWADKQAYTSKERVLEALTPFLVECVKPGIACPDAPECPQARRSERPGPLVPLRKSNHPIPSSPKKEEGRVA